MNSNTNSRIQNIYGGSYIPYIDGIRSIAILPVVIYHLFEEYLTGGFVGVDIFFVISGYLITLGIVKETKKGTFSIKRFYEKRIRRIIPAYFALIIFVLAVCLWFTNGFYLTGVFKMSMLSSVFGANFYFATLSNDYFEPAFFIYPLVNLWSLAVEEQFYVFIPVLFILMRKMRMRAWATILIVLFVVSFILSALPYFDLHSHKWSFYMLHTRAWELLAGSLLALYTYSKGSSKVSAPVGTSLACVGLLLCLLPCFLYSARTPFPGPTALAPVLGAVLLLRYGGFGFVGRALSIKPMVGVGQISYSLYLWHWPLFVFSTMTPFYCEPHVASSVAFVLSFVAAYLSWKYIELPIRLLPTWNFKKAIAMVVGSCVLVIGMGVAVFKIPALTEFFVFRHYVTSTGNASLKDRIYPENLPNPANCELSTGLILLGSDNPSSSDRFVLFGDSHAGHYTYAMNEWSKKKNIAGYKVSRNSTIKHSLSLVFSESASLDANRQHAEYTQTVLSWLETQPQITHVIISQWWQFRIEGEYDGSYDLAELQSHEPRSNNEAFVRVFLEFCESINRMGKKIIIMGPSPLPRTHFLVMHTVAQRSGYERTEGMPYERFKAQASYIQALLDTVATKYGATIIAPSRYFYRSGDKSNYYTDEGKPMLYDDSHLTDEAAALILDYFDSELSEALGIQNEDSAAPAASSN